MGYGKSHATVERVTKLLQSIADIPEEITILKVPSPEPARLISGLRAALHVVGLYPKTYESFTGIKARWEIRQGDNAVILRRRIGELFSTDNLVFNFQKDSNRRDFVECNNLLQIIGCIIKHRDEVKEFGFPNAKLIDNELRRLKQFVESKGLSVNYEFGFLRVSAAATEEAVTDTIEVGR